MSLASLTIRSFCSSDNGPWIAEQSCSGFKGLSKGKMVRSMHASSTWTRDNSDFYSYI
jgi:hypothetical protein